MNTKTIEQLNRDMLLDDVLVRWCGRMVLLEHGGKVLTVLTATANLQDKIVRWLNKNHYRCSQMHDGKIWL